MAERISDFSPRRIGRPSLYPWGEWTDGSKWRIERGEDFDCTPKSMAVTLYSHARRNGLGVEIRIDGDVVQFQFAPLEAVAA